jgi:hypothetical protein
MIFEFLQNLNFFFFQALPKVVPDKGKFCLCDYCDYGTVRGSDLITHIRYIKHHHHFQQNKL